MLACGNWEEQKGVANMCGDCDKAHERMVIMSPFRTYPTKKEEFYHGDTRDSSICVLELAANNDVLGFQMSVEQRNENVDAVGIWYIRHHGTRQMALEQRTPAMIAALYGSLDVLRFIINYHNVNGGDIDQACGSDGSSALHCAASGGSPHAMEAIKLLLDAGTNVNVCDAHGRRPVDVLVVSPRLSGLKEMMLELLCRKRSRSTSIEEESKINHDCFLHTSLKCVASTKVCSGEVHSAPCSPMSPHTTTGKGSIDDTVKCRGYPVDPSLPDIKNSFYTTDEFRMYCFKIRPCSRAYSHDWTECPFAHPGENARRRDPRRYHYSCVPCPDYRKGECSRGDGCEYAHGVFESWLHPAQYRTRLCKDGTGCSRRVCFFAHTAEELRPLFVSTGSGLPSPISPGFTDACPMSPPLAPCSPMMAPTFSPLHTVQSTIQGTLRTPPMSPSSSSLSSSWSQPTIPVLHLPGASLQASRLRPAFTAHDGASALREYDGQHLNDFQSVSAHSLSTQARLNAAMAVSGNVATSSRARYKSLGLNVVPAKLDELFALESISPGRKVHEERLLERSDDHSPFFPQVVPQEQLNAWQAAHTKGSSDPRSILSMNCGQGLGTERNVLSKALLSPAFAGNRRAPLGRNEMRSESAHESGGGGLVWPDWGSPMGKPEWGMQKNDLLKVGNHATCRMKVCDEVEMDPSWVHKLGKQGQPLETYPTSGTSVCYDDDEGVDASNLASWIDNLFLDQIVA